MTRKFVGFSLGIGLLATAWMVATPPPAHAAHWRAFANTSQSADAKDGDAPAPKPTPKHGGPPRPVPHPGPQDGGDR